MLYPSSFHPFNPISNKICPIYLLPFYVYSHVYGKLFLIFLVASKPTMGYFRTNPIPLLILVPLFLNVTMQAYQSNIYCFLGHGNIFRRRGHLWVEDWVHQNLQFMLQIHSLYFQGFSPIQFIYFILFIPIYHSFLMPQTNITIHLIYIPLIICVLVHCILFCVHVFFVTCSVDLIVYYCFYSVLPLKAYPHCWMYKWAFASNCFVTLHGCTCMYEA